MNQTEHRESGAGLSQCDIILFALLESGDWIPMPELARLSGSYNVHSRIDELRGRGHNIECRCRRVDGARRKIFSDYRIIQKA